MEKLQGLLGNNHQLNPRFLTDHRVVVLSKWFYILLWMRTQLLLTSFRFDWTAQNLEDPFFDFSDDLAFGVETCNKVPNIPQSAKMDAKRVGVD